MTNPFGNVVSRARKKQGLTQKDVANKLGYTTPQFISNWERGISVVPYEDILKLCEILKLKAEVVAKAIKEHKYQEIDLKLQGAINAH